MSPTLSGHAIHLRLAQPAHVDTGKVPATFNGRAADWLGTSVEADADPDADSAAPRRRYLTDLQLPLHDRAPRMTFKKAAFVEIGEVTADGDGYEVEISWRSSSLAPLFPVFAGHLAVTPTEIRLEGYYAPPGGDVGAVLDRAFLNIAARGTARWFLERVADALELPARSSAR